MINFKKVIDNIFGDHIITFEYIYLGGNGETHRPWINGTDINYLIIREN